MTPEEKLAAIDRLLNESTQKIKEYAECLEKDMVFEVKKKIRLRLKEIETELKRLEEGGSQSTEHVHIDGTSSGLVDKHVAGVSYRFAPDNDSIP